MTWEAWFTLIVLGMCFFGLALNRFAPDIIMIGGLTLLLVCGILSPQEALAGLANEGMVTVGVLYVVVSGLKETGGIAWIVHSLLGKPKSLTQAQAKLMTPVAALSAFLNNTPVVALFIPAVQDWAKKHRLPVSKLMMPLSFISIAGGTCTLIGTSTNLVVNGLLIAKTDTGGLSMFEIAWIGLPVVMIVMLYIVFASKWLLPERSKIITQFSQVREYTVEMIVEPDTPIVGQTIEEVGLRHLPGLYLIEIDRNDRLIPAVSPTVRLQGNDRLVFAGIVDSIIDLQKIKGLKPATDQVFKLDSTTQTRYLTEAVVSNICPVVGKSIREGRFRTLYNAAVIAVARNGGHIKKKIGDIILRPGDTLLLIAHPSFIAQQRNSRDFYLVSRLEENRPVRHERAMVAVSIMVAMVLIVALDGLSMLKAAMLAAGLMIITRCTTGRIARREVNWQVLVVIAASFGIGIALQNTGAALSISQSLIALAGGSPWAALGFVFISTALFSAMATNNAAAVVMFPIAMATAQSLDVSFLPFVLTVMVAASASFAIDFKKKALVRMSCDIPLTTNNYW
ncbi:MAG: SLC13 family permease [Pseudomonadota bacterium]